MSLFASKRLSSSTLAVAAVVAALVSACAPQSETRDVVLLDEELQLSRDGQIDSATRELSVPAGTVVAIAEELGADFSLTLTNGAERKTVDSNLQGEGFEVASLTLAQPGRITIELRGILETDAPGKARVVVRTLAGDEIEAFGLWTDATPAGLSASDAENLSVQKMGHVIELLESTGKQNARLVSMARLVRARMLYFHEMNWLDARDEARRASESFLALETPDALNGARAQRLQAAALQEIALDTNAVAPTAAEADVEARRIYGRLLAPDSALDVVGRARVENFLGVMDLDAEAWSAAEKHFATALAAYRGAGYRRGIIQTLGNIAVLSDYRGDHQAASQAYDSLLLQEDPISNPDVRVTLLINAANADVNIGRFELAIQRLIAADEMAISNDLAPAHARALYGLGLAYWAQGDVHQATTFLTAAIDLGKSLSDGAASFAGLRLLGTLKRENGDLSGALARHVEALQRAPGPMTKIRARIEIARDHLALKNPAAAIASGRAGLAVALEEMNHPIRTEAKLVLAESLLAQGQLTKAEALEVRKLVGGALQSAADAADVASEITALRTLARLETGRGENDAAREHLDRAVSTILKYQRSSPDPELGALTRQIQRQTFADYLDAQLRSGEKSPQLQDAVWPLESLRSLNFWSGAHQSGAEDAALETQLDALAARQLRAVQLRNMDDAPAGQLAAAQLEMAKIRARIDQLRLQMNGRKDDSPTATRSADWIRAGKSEAQLSYAMSNDRVVVWLRSASGIEAKALTASGAEISAMIVRIAAINKLQHPDRFEREIDALSERLLPAGLVSAEYSHVRIVADEVLGLVPFAALRSPSDPKRRFGETHTLTMTPSLVRPDIAHPTRPPRKWRLVALDGSGASPRVATNSGSALLPPLAAARVEINGVTSEFGASSTNVQVLKDALADAQHVKAAMENGADVMHFATHALVDLQQPLASMLWLPSEKSALGEPLTAGQIAQWRGNVGLAFLNGCSTAVGPTNFAGGMPGLQRAFLQAGSDHVIATLWPVEDSLAKQFALRFYQEMGKGLDPARAMSEVQRAWSVLSAGDSPQMASRKRVAAWAYVLYSL
jgi:CHAT domain-containing protein/tetratricopeptide (TPR) repeat protein